jgi:hypothetical protein
MLRATKEECQRQLDILQKGKWPLTQDQRYQLERFLMACLTRLPTEAAVERDRERRRRLRQPIIEVSQPHDEATIDFDKLDRPEG